MARYLAAHSFGESPIRKINPLIFYRIPFKCSSFAKAVYGLRIRPIEMSILFRY
jgi:hypothetical protein